MAQHSKENSFEGHRFQRLAKQQGSNRNHGDVHVHPAQGEVAPSPLSTARVPLRLPQPWSRQSKVSGGGGPAGKPPPPTLGPRETACQPNPKKAAPPGQGFHKVHVPSRKYQYSEFLKSNSKPFWCEILFLEGKNTGPRRTFRWRKIANEDSF